jgi:hypothetical protein
MSEKDFSKQEAQRRFEAALRGARLVGHKPMKSMTPKRAKGKASLSTSTTKNRARAPKD